MSGRVVFEPRYESGTHPCNPSTYTSPTDVPIGSIWVCDECMQLWRNQRTQRPYAFAFSSWRKISMKDLTADIRAVVSPRVRKESKYD